MRENLKEFKCSRCGDCCRYWGGRASATDNDLRRWRLEGRNDILQYVELGIVVSKKIVYARGDEWDGLGEAVMSDMFISPGTGDELNYCPFLRKETRKKTHICRINGTKPDICREFPFDNLGEARADDGACEVCPNIRKMMGKTRHRL